MADNSDREMRLSLVTLVVRITLGMIFLFYGLGKFMMGYSNYAGWMINLFKDTWLPGFALLPFTYALPFIEVGLGALLLAGILSRWTFVATGLLLAALIFGQVILQKPEVVAQNLVFTILITIGIWASEHDRFSLDHFRKKAG